ncbi:hypothetical protein T484DRAFT_1951617 [Baffinella frigidus]|nr:hypothetical protein T484DRAFT_1951617 [Cryptophyta sp. CCMP2293]
MQNFSGSRPPSRCNPERSASEPLRLSPMWIGDSATVTGVTVPALSTADSLSLFQSMAGCLSLALAL